MIVFAFRSSARLETSMEVLEDPPWQAVSENAANMAAAKVMIVFPNLLICSPYLHISFCDRIPVRFLCCITYVCCPGLPVRGRDR